MSNVLDKIKSLKLDKKNIFLIATAIIMLLLIIVSDSFGNKSSTDIKDDGTVYSSEYIKQTEKELEVLLEKINGAGKVKVMLTLESCYENVYAKGYSKKEDENENSKQNEFNEEYIIVKKGTGNEECLVVKVFEPTVKGVAVIAQGADNVKVKNAIIQTVCALFNISTAKVSVEKMS